MNFCSKLTNTDLINELEKRSLSTDGSKAELINRLSDAIIQEDLVEIFREEENYDSEDETDFECNDKNEKKIFNTDDNKNEKNIRKEEKKHLLKTADKIKPARNRKNNEQVISINDDDDDTKNNEKLSQSDYDSNENQLRSDDSATEKGRNILWVYKVKRNVKAVDLKDLLSKYGKVLSVKIVMNGKSPSGNCFGCIQLSSNADVENCIKHLNKTEFRGNIISVTKNINDITHADLIEGNGSPDNSWRSIGKQKNNSSVKSSVPFTCGSEVTKVNNVQNNPKYCHPVRVSNFNNDYHKDRVQNFRGRGYSRPMLDEGFGHEGKYPPFRSSDYRSNRNNYKEAYVGDSRPVYGSRYESRVDTVYRDRPGGNREESDTRHNRYRQCADTERVTPRYESYYDRPNYNKRPSDYKLTHNSDQLPFKRVRPDLESARMPRRYEDRHSSPYHEKQSYRADYRDKKPGGPAYEREYYAGDYQSKRASAHMYQRWKPPSYNDVRDSYHNNSNYRPRNY